MGSNGATNGARITERGPDHRQYTDSTGAPSNYVENTREYHGFRRGIYMYPCDEEEKDRMDMYHHIFTVARRKDELGRDRLHKAPIDPRVETRILDLGTGTGIWPMQMAERYPMAFIQGIDIVNIQPPLIPFNVRFKVPMDFEDVWDVRDIGDQPWDLIHLRLACGSVSSWDVLYAKIYNHLKPGGWLEHIEIDLEPRYEEEVEERSPQLASWYNYLRGATERASRSLQYQHNTRELLEKQGFTEVDHEVIRLPLNEWPTDDRQKFLGRWYNLGICQGLEALTYGPLTRAYEWPLENVQSLLREVRPQVCSRRIHAFNDLHIWIARKPES